MPRRAETFGSFSLAGAAGALRYGVEIVASGARFDTAANAPASRLAGYALLNLRAAYVFSPACTVSVRWNNALDKDYELVRGYNTAGSNVLLSLDYTPQ